MPNSQIRKNRVLRVKAQYVIPMVFVTLCFPGMIVGLDISLTNVAILMFLTFVGAAIGWARKTGAKLRFAKPNHIFAPLVFCMFLYVVAFGRTYLIMSGYMAESITNSGSFFVIMLFLGFLSYYFASANGQNSSRNFVNVIFLTLFMFCALEFLLHLMGVEHARKLELPQAGRPAVILQLIGLQMERVALPISTSVQIGGLGPAILWAMSIAGYVKHRRSIFLVSGALALALLLLVDARSMIIAPILATAAWRQFRSRPTILVWIAIIVPALPVIFTAVGRLLLPFLVAITSNRGAQLGMFSNREFIWNNVWPYLSEASVVQIFFGNGAFGQVRAGIVKNYSFLFGQWSEMGTALVHLHNSYLQILIDIGLFGLLAFTILIGTLTWHAAKFSLRADDYTADALGISLLTLLWIAGTEVTLLPYAKEGFFMTLLVWIGIANIRPIRRSVGSFGHVTRLGHRFFHT